MGVTRTAEAFGYEVDVKIEVVRQGKTVVAIEHAVGVPEAAGRGALGMLQRKMVERELGERQRLGL